MRGTGGRHRRELTSVAYRHMKGAARRPMAHLRGRAFWDGCASQPTAMTDLHVGAEVR
jgi:hypothetical protein